MVTVVAGIFVQVTPATATVQTGASQNFTATITGTTNHHNADCKVQPTKGKK